MHWKAGQSVRILQLLTNIMKSVSYTIRVNGIEDMQYKLKTAIHVLKRFVALLPEDSYASIVITINMISERINTSV